ncbi:MAG: DUF1456 family protein [Granulosicoccus sp.]
MDSNDLNRRVRYALSLDDADVIDLFRLVSYTADIAQISAWRIKEGNDGYLPCPPDALSAMLSGLIIQRRGVREEATPGSDSGVAATGAEGAPPKPSIVALDNNAVLKQIRIALSLKTDEVHELIQLGGGKLGKSEVNALFRKPAARNYRRCGDQVLRWFLSGLAKRRESEQ